MKKWTCCSSKGEQSEKREEVAVTLSSKVIDTIYLISQKKKAVEAICHDKKLIQECFSTLISKDVCNVGNLNGEKESCRRQEKKTLIGEEPVCNKEEDSDLRKELGREKIGGGELLGEEKKLGVETQEKENSQLSVIDAKGDSDDTRDGFEKAKQRGGHNFEERVGGGGGGKKCESVATSVEREEEYTQL